VEVFALYVEGLRPGDGARLLRSARRIAASGRTVLLYRAGRTAEGARATASHTATLAGPYAVARALAEEAGVVVADRLADFEDLVRLFCRMRGRRAGGTRLGAVSNAGFECVAVADALAGLTLAQLGPDTRTAIATLLRDARLESVVAPGNPLDTTPLLGDRAFAEAARLVLDDPGVDLGLIGCVPLTPALATLPGDLDRPDSIAHALAALWRASLKPWVAVVDAGPLYDPFASALEAGGVPTFRTADRALALLSVWARQRITPSSAS
jgi:acyl-CoA synthetase (NDP forming)